MARQGLKDKDINLLNVVEKKRESSKYTAAMKYAILPVALAVISLGFFVGFTLYNQSLDNKIADTQNEIKKAQETLANDPNIERYTALMKAKNNLEKYKRMYKNIQSYPELSQNTFDRILVASGSDVSVTTFSYVRDSQVITLQIEAVNANSTEEFVRRLKDLKIFSGVDYVGYTSQAKTSETTSTAPEETASKEEKTASSSADVLQQLLESMNGTKTTTDTTSEETATVSVYTATILCTLK